MDGTGECHAKRSKRIPKYQRPNVFSHMQMLIHNTQWGQRRIEVLWIRNRGMKGGKGMGVGMTVE